MALALCLVGLSAVAADAVAAEQLHVAYGAQNDSMVVCWATKNVSPELTASAQVVRWGLAGSDRRTWTTLPASTSSVKAYFKHRATLTGLAPGEAYEYEVGDNTTASFVRSSFRSRRLDLDWSPRLAMFGDLGWTNDQVLPLLSEEAALGDVDAIVLFGDMVYWANGESENAFMRDVSAMSANGSIPFHRRGDSPTAATPPPPSGGTRGAATPPKPRHAASADRGSVVAVPLARWAGLATQRRLERARGPVSRSHALVRRLMHPRD